MTSMLRPSASCRSTCINGSNRPPKRDVVLRTPLATARTWPRPRASSVTMRSASPSLWVRNTTARSRYRLTSLLCALRRIETRDTPSRGDPNTPPSQRKQEGGADRWATTWGRVPFGYRAEEGELVIGDRADGGRGNAADFGRGIPVPDSQGLEPVRRADHARVRVVRPDDEADAA